MHTPKGNMNQQHTDDIIGMTSSSYDVTNVISPVGKGDILYDGYPHVRVGLQTKR